MSCMDSIGRPNVRPTLIICLGSPMSPITTALLLLSSACVRRMLTGNWLATMLLERLASWRTLSTPISLSLAASAGLMPVEACDNDIATFSGDGSIDNNNVALVNPGPVHGVATGTHEES